jgi:predicted GNAT family acetyltransferase
LCYPADVIPFCGVEEASPAAFAALRESLEPGRLVYLTADRVPAVPGIEVVNQLACWQMHATAIENAAVLRGRIEAETRLLGASDVLAMSALTDLAFPGFFRTRTHALGQYYGVHVDGELVAMAGERLALPGFREISAVCTHPAHTGKGYAAGLMVRLMRAHAAAGLRSFLHVATENERAIALYERLGFVKTRQLLFHQLRVL